MAKIDYRRYCIGRYIMKKYIKVEDNLYVNEGQVVSIKILPDGYILKMSNGDSFFVSKIDIFEDYIRREQDDENKLQTSVRKTIRSKKETTSTIS